MGEACLGLSWGYRMTENIRDISSPGDWNIPKLDGDNGCITLNLLKNVELYT